MNYPFKYPEVYAELAKQGKTKKALAQVLQITTAGLAYKQTKGDFTGDEMRIVAGFLGLPAAELFDLHQSIA